MKKNIGSVLALYPTPTVVVGTMIEDKPTWLLAGHVGIIGHDRILVSLFNKHHTNQGIINTGRLSINIVDEALLPRADYVGITSGAKTDKSQVFAWHPGKGGTPVIDDSPLVLFEMPTYSYLRTGEMIGKCTTLGKKFLEENH